MKQHCAAALNICAMCMLVLLLCIRSRSAFGEEPRKLLVQVIQPEGIGVSAEDRIQITAAVLQGCQEELLPSNQCVSDTTEQQTIQPLVVVKLLALSVAKLDEVYVLKLKRVDQSTGLTDSEIRDTGSAGLAPLLAHNRDWVRKLFPDFVKQRSAPITKTWWFWTGVVLSAAALTVGGLAYERSRRGNYDDVLHLP